MKENVCGAKTYDELDIPEYQCHKKVKAFKITKMAELRGEDGRVEYILGAGDGVNPFVFVVSNMFVKKHNPEIGGYYVRYQDGYESYSPEGAFEEGYSLITDESQALSCTPTAQEVTISKKEYFNLLQRDLELASLNDAGVDNWEGYDISREYLEAIILDLEEGELKDFMKR